MIIDTFTPKEAWSVFGSPPSHTKVACRSVIGSPPLSPQEAWTVLGSPPGTKPDHSSPRPGRRCPYVDVELREEAASGDATRAVKRVSNRTPSFTSSSSTVLRGYEVSISASSSSAERRASRRTSGSVRNIRSHSGFTFHRHRRTHCARRGRHT